MLDQMLTYDDPMFRIVEIRRYAEDGSGRVQGAWQYAARQPSWIARLALTVFLFIVMLPIIALLLLAFLAGVVVFLILAVGNTLVRLVRSVLPTSGHGRDNVRVIRRE